MLWCCEICSRKKVQQAAAASNLRQIWIPSFVTCIRNKGYLSTGSSAASFVITCSPKLELYVMICAVKTRADHAKLADIEELDAASPGLF